ncbi:MAG: DUF86 domain-containing protein [Bacteroidetes bacterium]|nr:DUF86 domain-containing protein [Fibrella sp.]
MRRGISDKARIEHMLESIKQIQQFTEGVAYDAYKQDLKLRLALTRLVEILGEAADYVSEDTKLRFADVEWILLSRVRNILIHEYFGVDYDIIWDSIQRDIPPLRIKLETILKTLDSEL